MIRPTILVFLAVAVVGCKGQDARVPMDPFYGQTKIAPPATGEIARRPYADPYYPRSTSAPATSESRLPSASSRGSIETEGTTSHLVSAPGAADKSSGPDYASGDRIEIPKSAHREMPPAETLAADAPSATRPLRDTASIATTTGRSLEERTKVTQTLAPRDDAFARQSPGYSGAHLSQQAPTASSQNAVDISDLPPADRGAGAIRDDRVQQASATEVTDRPHVRFPTRADTVDSLGRFGYLTDYSRLRGKLEYLERDQRWKLRYIPIDGKTDEYGGSVAIEDSSALSGFERGDFVEAHGRIVESSNEAADYAPRYELADIRSLTD